MIFYTHLLKVTCETLCIIKFNFYLQIDRKLTLAMFKNCNVKLGYLGSFTFIVCSVTAFSENFQKFLNIPEFGRYLGPSKIGTLSKQNGDEVDT